MPTQGFTVMVDGTEADIERVEAQGSTVSLDLEDTDNIMHGESVTVAYSPPAAGVLQDVRGNRVAAIPAAALTVRNNVPDPTEKDAPEATSASVVADGTVVRLVFDEQVEFSLLVPGVVFMLRRTEQTPTSITWAWMAPVEIDAQQGAPTWYEYRRRRSGGVWSRWTRITKTTVTITGLSDQSDYEIEVRAGNAAGPGQKVSDSSTTGTARPSLYGGQGTRIYRSANGYGGSDDTGILIPSASGTAADDFAFDSDGDLYLASNNADRIYRRAGGYNGTWDNGITVVGRAPRGVALDSADNLYYADALSDRIYRMAGGYGNTWDAGIFPPAGEDFCHTLAFDSADNLYCVGGSTNRIFRMLGGYGNTWDGGIQLPLRNARPQGLTFDDDGDLYTVDTARRLVYRRAGGYTGTWDDGTRPDHNYQFIAFGPDP